MNPILQIKSLSKSFGPVKVLQNVNFNIYPGKVTALIGDNGAGKSTLVKCIAGIHPIDKGEFIFNDKQVNIHSPKDSSALGIEVVYQDLALCDNLDVTQNMYLGREIHKFGILNTKTMEAKARQTLASLSVKTIQSTRQNVASLSGGQRQTVAIARAVLWNSKIIILDEPTAALGVAQTAQVLNLIRNLADKGLGVVLISHNMNDVLEVSDRVCAMFLGQIAADIETSKTSLSTLVELITAGKSETLGINKINEAEDE